MAVIHYFIAIWASDSKTASSKNFNQWVVGYLIKDKPIDLINRTFIRENTQYLACNEECAFFTSDVYNKHNLWSCQKVCDAPVYLLNIIFIRFGTKLYRLTIGIPMGTNCAPLVEDLFRFCYETDFMKSLGWGLTISLWLGQPWFNYWFSFTLAYSRISHEYSSLFIVEINLNFMFSL